MHEIDFLPSEYRESHARRKGATRRVLLLVVLGAALAAAALFQHREQRRLRAELARLEPAKAQGAAIQMEIDRMQADLRAAQAEAELLTYLRHPWPRTQILAALLAPLPDEITFEELQIVRETASRRAVAPPAESREGAAPSGLPVATLDLNRLRDEVDGRETLVSISGTASDSQSLHRYLAELDKVDLFARTELVAIETSEIDPQRLRFSVTVTMRPGYGQSGGLVRPAPPRLAAATPQSS
jgi:Tfp pilus assembly protein PilN